MVTGLRIALVHLEPEILALKVGTAFQRCFYCFPRLTYLLDRPTYTSSAQPDPSGSSLTQIEPSSTRVRLLSVLWRCSIAQTSWVLVCLVVTMSDTLSRSCQWFFLWFCHLPATSDCHQHYFARLWQRLVHLLEALSASNNSTAQSGVTTPDKLCQGLLDCLAFQHFHLFHLAILSIYLAWLWQRLINSPRHLQLSKP